MKVFIEVWMKQMLDRDETSDDDLSIAFTNKPKVDSKEHIVTDSYRHLLQPLISLFVSKRKIMSLIYTAYQTKLSYIT